MIFKALFWTRSSSLRPPSTTEEKFSAGAVAQSGYSLGHYDHLLY